MDLPNTLITRRNNNKVLKSFKPNDGTVSHSWGLCDTGGRDAKEPWPTGDKR